MALSTNIYAEVITTFPASVEGAGGITVTKSGGVFTITFAGSGIAVNSIGLDKIEQITTDRLLGRDTDATGDVEQLTVGGGIEFTGSGGVQRSALTGDITAAAGSNATTIANDAVTTDKIAAANVTTAKLQDSAVTLAKIADQSDATILANISGSSGPPSAASLTSVLDDMLGSTQGQIAYRNASTWTVLATGTAEDVLTTKGAGANPVWQTVPSAAFPRGYLSGLEMSNGTDADHDIDFTAGVCRDSTNGANITGSAITKQFDATWASGDAAGGLSSSLTALANSTWYHVFAVLIGGSADYIADTSITCANGVTDHSVTNYRRIGSFYTDGSANITAFTQRGDLFQWDVNASVGNPVSVTTSAANATLQTPTGLKTIARLTGFASGGSTLLCRISDPDVSDQAPSNTNMNVLATTTGDPFGVMEVATNTSAQVRHRGGGSISLYLGCEGYIDRRGRDD